jgi:hypothetical protein
MDAGGRPEASGLEVASEGNASAIPKRVVFAVFAIAFVVFAQYGAQGRLGRDDAVYVYSGQQFAEGVPHYVSVFEVKGPLSPILTGVAITAGRALGVGDVYAARGFYLIISALAVVAVFLFSAALLRDRYAGLLSAAVMTGAFGFGQHALSGPRAKTPMVLFVALTLWLITTRRWLWAGFAAALAGLVWQPTAVFGLVAIAAAWLQAEGTREKVRAATAVCAGALIPLVLVVCYFAVEGALVEFIDGYVLFNLQYLDRAGETLATRFAALGNTLFRSYRPMGALIAIGLAAALAVGLMRLRARGFAEFARDRWAPVLASLLLAAAWSVVDYQSYPDFFVFLPFAALGAGLVLRRAAEGIAREQVEGGRTSGAARLGVGASLAVCGLLVVMAGWSYRLSADTGFVRQTRDARRIAEAVGAPEMVLAIGSPEWLVLQRRRHIDPYVFIIAGIDRQIEARAPGGFDGWLTSLEAAGADVVVLGSTWMELDHQRRFDAWLARHYQKVRVGSWALHVRKERVDLLERLRGFRLRRPGSAS